MPVEQGEPAVATWQQLMAHIFISGVFLPNKLSWHPLSVVLDRTMPAREPYRLAPAYFYLIARPVFVQASPSSLANRCPRVAGRGTVWHS
jgi:hypothetical protein